MTQSQEGKSRRLGGGRNPNSSGWREREKEKDVLGGKKAQEKTSSLDRKKNWKTARWETAETASLKEG